MPQCTRMMLYTPTLVMMANSAATGALAAAYVAGNQKLSGTTAAFSPNTTSNSSAAELAMAADSPDRLATRSAMSAMFSVPVTPYSTASAIRNNADADKFSTT